MQDISTRHTLLPAGIPFTRHFNSTYPSFCKISQLDIPFFLLAYYYYLNMGLITILCILLHASLLVAEHGFNMAGDYVPGLATLRQSRGSRVLRSVASPLTTLTTAIAAPENQSRSGGGHAAGTAIVVMGGLIIVGIGVFAVYRYVRYGLPWRRRPPSPGDRGRVIGAPTDFVHVSGISSNSNVATEPAIEMDSMPHHPGPRTTPGPAPADLEELIRETAPNHGTTGRFPAMGRHHARMALAQEQSLRHQSREAGPSSHATSPISSRPAPGYSRMRGSHPHPLRSSPLSN